MMPKVIGNDSLIARVNEVQGCMYRQSNELGRLNRAVKKYKDENAKLRELLADACGYINHPADVSWTHMRRKEARDSLNGRMRELGIEVWRNEQT